MILTLLGCMLLGLSCSSPISNAMALREANYQEDMSVCVSMAEEEGMESPLKNPYELKDLSGNVFYAEIGEKEGFMVYDPKVESFIEKSVDLDSPYDFTSTHDYYYFGPMNYFERFGDKFYYLIDNQSVDLDYVYGLQHIFDEQLETFRTAQSISSRQTYCEKNSYVVSTSSITEGNKTYIKNFKLVF